VGAVVFVIIWGLFIISGFAGFLPVDAWGLWCKWLIISVFLVSLVCIVFAGWCLLCVLHFWKCGTSTSLLPYATNNEPMWVVAAIILSTFWGLERGMLTAIAQMAV